MSFFRLLGGLLDRLFVVAGAFLGSQVPAFMDQYMQRLAGHVEELNYMIQEMARLASQNSKTLDQYIQKFLDSTDPDFMTQGNFMQSVELRLESFSASLAHLRDSSIWSKFYVFLTEVKCSVFKSTLHSFRPSLSLSIEGLCYTFIGIVFGYLSYWVLLKLMQYVYQQILSFFQRKR
jgi:hypothetical protein